MHTISSLLEMPRFSYLTLLNKNADTSRIIETVEVSETPDVANSNFMEKNALLLTTAMVFQNDITGFCKFIEELNAFPASGLAIKIGRFIDEIDQRVIDTADKLGFPLLIIPIEKTLGVTCHQILNHLWDTQTEKLTYALKVQSDFSNLLLQKAPLSKIVAEISIVLKQDVFLLNPFLEIVETSYNNNRKTKMMVLVQKLIKEKPELRNKKIKEITFTPDDLVNVSVLPIRVMGYCYYYLVVLNSDKIPYPYSKFVLEQVNIILAFIIYKNRTLSESFWHFRENLFFNLVIPNPTQNQAEFIMESYGSETGLIKSSYYNVIVVGIDNLQSYKDSAKTNIYSMTFEWIESQLRVHFKNAVAFPVLQESNIAILLQEADANIFDKIKNIQNNLYKFLSISISFALGSSVRDSYYIWSSYTEAKNTYKKYADENLTGFIKSYNSTGIVDLMQFIPKDHTLHFSIHVLKELAYPEDSINIELRHTLKKYLDNQGDLTKTAKDLFLHRNTVKYRIDKVNEILKVDIDNPDQSLQLRIALLITEINK